MGLNILFKLLNNPYFLTESFCPCALQMEMENLREEKRKTEQRLAQMEEEQQKQRERLALEAAKQSAVCYLSSSSIALA